MKKRTLKIKRAIACFLTALMLLTMLPVGAFAADDNLKDKLGITTEGVTVTEISKENETKLSEAAAERYWGIYADGIAPGLGRVHSACHIGFDANPAPEYVTLTMDKPEQISEAEGGDEAPDLTTGWVVLALVNDKIVTYPTKIEDDKLQFDVRLGKNGTDLALACLTDASKIPFSTAVGDWGTLTLTPGEVEKNDSLGYVRPYTLTLELSEGVKERLETERFLYNFDLVFILNSVGLKIDAESVSFDENDLFKLDPEQTEKVEEGSYKFTASVDLDSWKDKNFTDTVGISYAAPNAEPLLFEGEMQVTLPPPNPWAGIMSCVPLAITVVEPPADMNDYHKITVNYNEGGKIEPHGVEGEVWVKNGESPTFTITPDQGYHIKDVKVNGESKGAITEYTFNNVTNDDNTITATFEKNPAVTITPADMTIYMGGDGGYDAVVGDNGEIESSTNSLPHPLFKVTMPEGSTVNPTDLIFTNGKSGNDKKTWKLVCDNPESDGEKYYHFDEGEDQEKVRVTYTYTAKDGTEYVVTDDTFDPTEIGDVFATCEIAIYPGENDLSTITAQATDGTEYNVSAVTGTLTVRAVEDSNATTDIATAVPEDEISTGEAVAVAPAGTTYTLNNTGVELPADDAKPSLLFDSIIEDAADSTARTDALKARINTALGTETNVYDIKYLDLVDANNGNAWIKASEPIDIYWGYPADTDQNTKFTVVHFKDLHRDGAQSGFELADISSCEVELIPAESTPQGIKFSVQPGQFSPFALIVAQDYTITATAGNGGSISPNGAVTVNAGADQTFTITSNSGYRIADVTVDGTSVGAVGTYTFEDVVANHTINATFTYNGGGTITPDPTPDPDPEPTPDPDEPGIADPDDTGVADWLNTKDHDVFLNGYPDGSFGPDRSMTRAEVAAMFSNLLLDKNVPITTSFSDVAEDAWYADAVNMLASLDMIAGYEDGTFRPDAPITRAEFTAIAMRFADAAPEGENIFSDVHAGDWFYDVVVGSIQYGWIGGYEDGTFRPQNTITRAEVTAITNRMLGRVADEAFIDAADALRSFSDLSDAHWAYYSIMEATNAHDYTTTDGVEEWEALH